MMIGLWMIAGVGIILALNELIFHRTPKEERSWKSFFIASGIYIIFVLLIYMIVIIFYGG